MKERSIESTAAEPVMRAILGSIVITGLFAVLTFGPANHRTALGQDVKVAVKGDAPKGDAPKGEAPKEGPKKEAPPAPFDQSKVDRDTLKSGAVDSSMEGMLTFFKNHTVTEADKAKILGLIKKLGDDSYEVRESASAELSKSGVAAISLLRTGMKDSDYEIVRRCETTLKIIEKVPVSTLAIAAARLLAEHKVDGVTEVLLNYLPLTDDESVREEIGRTFAKLAVRDKKPDAALEKQLTSSDLLRRSMATEAFARNGDPESRERMKRFASTEKDAVVRLGILTGLVESGKDKSMVADLIKTMPQVPYEKMWRADELLWRLAGDNGPTVSFGQDAAANAKAVEEWTKWWEGNQAKIDIAARLESESSFGLTIVCESPLRGGFGRVVALGSDGKERWKVGNVNWPTDCVVLPQKRVLIAEHNRNRIVEKDIDGAGKEHWQENVNNPCNVGRLPNGTTWAVGRNQIIEWERGDPGKPRKQTFNFVRNEYDIVAGQRMKNGDYICLTQNSQLLRINQKGQVVKSWGVGNGGGVNYYATVDVLPNDKVLCTLAQQVVEFDLNTGKITWTANVQFASSAQRMRNGNTLVAQQNMAKVTELDREGKPTNKFEYKGDGAGFRPFRAFKR